MLRKKRQYQFSLRLISISIVVILLMGLILLIQFGDSYQKEKLEAQTKIENQSTVLNKKVSISSGFSTNNGFTFYYKSGKKATGFQKIKGNTYYFDQSTGEEVGEMRDMSGEYWKNSSELGSYPDLTKYKNLSLNVSISENRTYLESDGRVIYVFYSSTGENNTTPIGRFAIQVEHSVNFYNSSENEGGKYAVSWLDHGVYLFHSVPVNSDGNYIVSNAKLLGKSPASHGCVHLSVADSEWLYDQAVSGALPVGTPVIINQ